MIFYFVKKLLQRSYTFLVLTFISLVIGAFLFGGVVSLTTSIRTFLVSEGKVLVGGDIVLRSAFPIATSSEVFTRLIENGHIIVEEQQVQAVFRSSSGESTSPANIRIVSNLFPLYGEIIIENGVFKLVEDGIYVEQDFLNRLGLNVGGEVLLGDKKMRILGVIVKEPDTVALGVSFTPRVIMLRNDFNVSGLDLSQSRTSYIVSIKENRNSKLTKTEIENISAYAKEKKIRFDDAMDGPNRLVRGLSSVSTFIGIVITIALFLVTVNIVANLVYVLARFKKTIALLKTFGASNKQIQTIYIYLLGLIGGVAGFIGSYLGVYVVNRYIPKLEAIVRAQISPTNELSISLLGGLFGIIFIIFSSFPFLSSLREVLPKELLAGVSQVKEKFSLFHFLFFVPIPLLLIVLLYVISRDVMLVLYGVGGLVLIFSFYVAISYILIEIVYKIRRRLPFILSSIFSFLRLRGFQTFVTAASIMTAFSGVFIIAAIEKNITINLNQNISKTAPALYLVDIKKTQVEEIKKIVGDSFKEYPIIRGRLLSVNERDMTQSSNPGITREFNMTYRTELIEGERLVEGVFGNGQSDEVQVSVDKGFGDELGGVKIGDTIVVFIQGINISAKVTSIREVDSTRGIPFFYLVFPPNVLSNFPVTYFGTAQVTPSQLGDIKKKLSEQYPNVIPIETKRILETVSGIISNVVLVVSIAGIPSILLGLILIIVMISQSLYERKGDVLILRAFGMNKKKITLLFILEASILILLSGGIAYIVAHIVAYVINVLVFSFEIFSFSLEPMYMIIGSLFFVVIFSYFVSTRIVNDSLKKLLAEK